MKTIHKTISILTLVMLSTSGCSDTFLELAPISQTGAINFYKTPADFQASITGAYATLQQAGMYGNWFLFTDERSDNTEQEENSGVSQPYGDFDIFQVGTTNPYIVENWNAHYQLINRVNTILDRIVDVSFTNATQKDQFTGEALFLRALAYFNLVQVYGDVPLVTKAITPAEAYASLRTPAADVYKQIIDDLTQAATKLPLRYTGNDVGRASKGAAQGLLGKVYLTRRQFTEATQTLKALIDANTYQLLPRYADVFVDANANNAESLFEVGYRSNSQGEGSSFATMFAPKLGALVVTGAGGGQGYNRPTKDMISAYEPGDTRKDVSLSESWPNGTSVANDPYVKKQYMTRLINPYDGDANWIVLRYADVLLMYAESLNEAAQPTQALPYLNQIRKRAGLPDKTVLSQAELRLAIEQERRVELAFEGHRWFDLLRTDRALAVMRAKGKVLSERDLLFPISQQQRDINPALTQNSGY